MLMVGALAALWTMSNAAATITSVSPNTLAVEGGTKVVVKGTGFAAGTTAVIAKSVADINQRAGLTDGHIAHIGTAKQYIVTGGFNLWLLAL